LDIETEEFHEEDVKLEENYDEYYDVKTTVNHKAPETSKKDVAIKMQNKKYVLVSQNPRRNSTRVTNKYRLRSKAMFDPSIKKEDVIVIEDHYEDAKVVIKQNTGKIPLHKELAKRGKQIVPFPTGPVTRDVTKLSRDKASAKGISRVPENKESNLIDLDHISDIPKSMDSTSSDEEHNS
jgi:hypothetical protein